MLHLIRAFEQYCNHYRNYGRMDTQEYCKCCVVGQKYGTREVILPAMRSRTDYFGVSRPLTDREIEVAKAFDELIRSWRCQELQWKSLLTELVEDVRSKGL